MWLLYKDICSLYTHLHDYICMTIYIDMNECIYVYRYGSIIYVSLGSHILISVWLNIYLYIYIYVHDSVIKQPLQFPPSTTHSSQQHLMVTLASEVRDVIDPSFKFKKAYRKAAQAWLADTVFFLEKNMVFFIWFFIWELNTWVGWSSFFWSTWGKLCLKMIPFFGVLTSTHV